MESKIKFVLIGSGNIGKTYLSAINKIPTAEIVGCVSSKDIKPDGFQNINFYKNLEDIDVNFDAVLIGTPNGLHHVSAIKAAELGKHVLCEKPIGISLDWIDKMIEACERNKVKLGVSYQRRFSSDNPIVKALIDNGSLGSIFSVDLSVKNYRDDSYYDSAAYRGTYELDGGGAFAQQACHYIDLYYWYFGKPSKVVSMLGTVIHDIEVEDHGVVICKHDSGMMSTITGSTACKPGFPAKMQIYSTKGNLCIENDVITHWDIEGIENPSVVDQNANTHTGAATAVVEDTTNHEFIINDFVGAIHENREPLITGESARNTTEIILEIYGQSI